MNAYNVNYIETLLSNADALQELIDSLDKLTLNQVKEQLISIKKELVDAAD